MKYSKIIIALLVIIVISLNKNTIINIFENTKETINPRQEVHITDSCRHIKMPPIVTVRGQK